MVEALTDQSVERTVEELKASLVYRLAAPSDASCLILLWSLGYKGVFSLQLR